MPVAQNVIGSNIPGPPIPLYSAGAKVKGIYAASVLMFYVFARYRYPLVPILMLFAAAGLAALPRRLRTDVRTTRWVALGAALLTVAAFVNRPMLSTDLMKAITEHNLGAALQEEGRLDEAIERINTHLNS